MHETAASAPDAHELDDHMVVVQGFIGATLWRVRGPFTHSGGDGPSGPEYAGMIAGVAS